MIRNVGQSLIRGSALGRAQRGLFHGKEKIYGNNVSYSNKKVRRTWLPHVVSKVLKSDLLGTELRINVTAKALRCIDKAGSLDDYILFTKEADLDSMAGLKLKKLLKAAWEKKYGTKFSARRITFERKIAYLLLAGKITAEEHKTLLATGEGVSLLPKELNPLHVERLPNPATAAAAAAAAVAAAAAAETVESSTPAAEQASTESAPAAAAL